MILLLALGGVVGFIAPLFIPDSYRNWLTLNAVRVVGALCILFGVFSTSYIHVPDGNLAQLFRVYGGGSLADGKIIAIDGENGPQATVLPPGFHVWLLVNVTHTVDTSKTEISIPAGKVGTLIAKDGQALRPGQAFADPFPAELGNQMLDAGVFLRNGGQRGPQLTVLAPGTYRLNRYLWTIEEKDAKEIPTGFVGVVKSNVWADIDFGTLRAKKPEKCEAQVRAVIENINDEQRLSAPQFPVGCIGIWDKPLQPGKYYLNPDAFHITDFDTRAQVWTYAGGYTHASISLTVDDKGGIVQKREESKIAVEPDNADRAVTVKMEGWDVPLELRVVAQVSPEDAACVVAGVGTLKQVEDRVLTPSIRAITRDVAGGTYEVTEAKKNAQGELVLDAAGKPILEKINRPTKVTDLIDQRPMIEGEIERRIRPEGRKSCVTIREVRLGEPSIPPELLVAVRRKQLATELTAAFKQEQTAQTERVKSENAKEMANQQGMLVAAEIGVQASARNAQAAKNNGDGERDKLMAIAAGQKAQMDVLGADATVRLRQFELVIDKVFGFADKHPDVLTAALTNAQKFVPTTVVGTGSDGLMGMLTALMSQSLQGGAAAPVK